MGKFVVLDHPLIQHKLTIIRRKDTGSNEFRRIVGEIGGLMTYEITRDLPLEDVEIEQQIFEYCLSILPEIDGRLWA